MIINPANKLNLVGGKAYQLNNLKDKFLIPPYFVVHFSIPDEINDYENQRVILKYFEDYRFELVAVRSSAIAEDSSTSSFAGVFSTSLNVNAENLIAAIETVLNSVHQERVIDYIDAKGLKNNGLEMGIVIQKMVKSYISGVCFSRTSDHPDSLILEACYGLGEALVSGEVTPDTYRVSRKDLKIESTRVGYQIKQLHYSTGNNVNVYEELPFHKRNARKLSDDQIIEVCKMVLKVERELSFKSADVEWAFENQRLFLLQARPYTGYSRLE